MRGAGLGKWKREAENQGEVRTDRERKMLEEGEGDKEKYMIDDGKVESQREAFRWKQEIEEGIECELKTEKTEKQSDKRKAVRSRGTEPRNHNGERERVVKAEGEQRRKRARQGEARAGGSSQVQASSGWLPPAGRLAPRGVCLPLHWGQPSPRRPWQSGSPLAPQPPAPTRDPRQEVFGRKYSSFRTEPLMYPKKLFSCGLLCMLLISLLQILLFSEVPGDPLTTGFYGKEVG